VQTSEEARYRMRLAAGFLEEARQDLELKRYRSCVDNSQLAAENAAKAVLALVAPVGATHEPAVLLRRVLSSDAFPSALQPLVERLAQCAAKLGWSVHVETDYGDSSTMQTPWELFDEGDARQALALAEEAVRLASELIGGA
jgi:HEPN domain-containing protein